MSENEQDARIALLEHDTSQRQGYRVHILTLAVATLGLLELWARVPASQMTWFLMSVLLGAFTAALVWCYLRGRWYGALAWRALNVKPANRTVDVNCPYDLDALLYRLSQGQAQAIRDKKIWHWKPTKTGPPTKERTMRKLHRQLERTMREVDRQIVLLGYERASLMMVSVVIGTVAFGLVYWLISPYLQYLPLLPIPGK